jgi:hypothetical protein
MNRYGNIEMMKLEDFEIGKEFYRYNILCRCTDIGTRTVAYIILDKDDESWYNGPPYAIVEHLADEYDMHVCFVTLEDYLEAYG